MLSARSLSATVAVLIALVGLLITTQSDKKGPIYAPPVLGVNNTALFIVLPHHGFSNVHLATTQALLERYPGIQQHYASFARLEKKVQRLSDLAVAKQNGAKPVKFHTLTAGRDYVEMLGVMIGNGSDSHTSPPGLAGLGEMCKRMEIYLSPWPAQEYMYLYREMSAIIAEVDPAVVVLDHQFVIAMDAARENNRVHATISPNGMSDLFGGVQPRGGFFWKYPAVGSGIPFPVPWSQIPSNVYTTVRLAYSVFSMKGIKEKRKYFAEHGLKDSFDIMKLHREDSPVITPSMDGASIPLEVIPRNATAVAPIVLSVAPAAEQDAKLYAWLEKGPTILINLGSTVDYNKRQATAMAGAIKKILDQSNVQILWKLQKGVGYTDDCIAPLQSYIADGRLKIESWLTVDPTAILESGHVVAFIHHGGANCYHEGVYGGVPHVILPLWADLYNFAALVEPLGIGLWACSKTAPLWDADCISDAVFQVIADNERGRAFREKAHLLGIDAKKMPGRYGAADIIANLAGSGKA